MKYIALVLLVCGSGALGTARLRAATAIDPRGPIEYPWLTDTALGP